MYFYENGKRISPSDMHKSQGILNFDQLNQNQNRLCKGKCIQFKATKPANGDRYASGQYRCQVCEIYLMEQGVVDNVRCKCCNFQVRSKPRNRLYKDKYNKQIRNVNEPSIKQELDEKTTDEIIEAKKSTPIYEESDNSVKTYYEFKEFLDSKMKLEANYQLVMLKELLEYGKLHKGEIADSLAYFNNKDSSDINSVKYYLNVPLYDVLLDHGFVTMDYDNQIQYYTINLNLTDFQKLELLEYLGNSITKYNREHNIPDNEHLNANNVGSIDWDKYNELLINQKPQDQTDKNIQQTEEKERNSKSRWMKKLLGISSVDAPIRKESMNESSLMKQDVESQEFKSVKIFESHNDLINITHCKVISTEIIQKDQQLTNDDIVRIFGVGNMGRIRYSSKNNVIILCDIQSGYYDNKLDKDFQIIYYTGEGQKGDQTLTGENQRVVNSETTPMFYFIEVPQEPGQRKRGALDNIYKFVGRVKYTKHAFKTENDIDGTPRQVIKFLLEVKE